MEPMVVEAATAAKLAEAERTHQAAPEAAAATQAAAAQAEPAEAAAWAHVDR